MSDPAIPYQNLVDATNDRRLIIETISPLPLRFYKALRSLAIIQLVLAVVASVVSASAFVSGVSRGPRYTQFNVDFTAIWLNILFVVACSLGVGSLRVPSGFRCPLISYFVLLIIGITLSPFYLWVTSIWANNATYFCSGEGAHVFVGRASDCPFLALNIILLLIGIVQSKLNFNIQS